MTWRAASSGASLSGTADATVHSLPGPRVSVQEVIDAIAHALPESAGRIGYEDVRLPFPEEIDSGSFAEIVPGFVPTPLAEGVRTTIERFRELLAGGVLPAPAT